MKSASFAYFIGFLLAMLALGSFPEVQGMDSEIEGMKEYLAAESEGRSVLASYSKILEQATVQIADENRDLFRQTAKGQVIFIPTAKIRGTIGWRYGGPRVPQTYQDKFESELKSGGYGLNNLELIRKLNER